MDIEPKNGQRVQEENVSTRGAQAIWPFSLAIVTALAFQYCPPLKGMRDSANQYVKDQFAAATKPKSQQECMMLALSRSPPAGCSLDKK